MATEKDSEAAKADAQEWASRQKNNVRLAYVMGAIAVAIFLISLWKYRPL